MKTTPVWFRPWAILTVILAQSAVFEFSYPAHAQTPASAVSSRTSERPSAQVRSSCTWTSRLRPCASISVNAERPARRYRLPLRLTTPRRTPSCSTTHTPLPGWLRRKFAGRTIRSFERNPNQLIFGSKPALPEYHGGQ